MKKEFISILPFIFLALVLTYYSYYEARMIGFPDGFLSDRDRWRKIVLNAFLGLNLSATLGFSYLAFCPSKTKFRVILIYLTTIVIFLVLDFYLCRIPQLTY